MQKNQISEDGTSLPKWIYKIYSVTSITMTILLMSYLIYSVAFSLIPSSDPKWNLVESRLDAITYSIWYICFLIWIAICSYKMHTIIERDQK
jgi:hypothetical protein